MNKIKKVLALLLALTLAVSMFSACGSSDATTASASSAAAAASGETAPAAETQKPMKTEDPKAEKKPAEASGEETEPEAAKAGEASTRTVTDMSGHEVTIPAEVDTYVESWFAHNAVDVMLNKAEGMLVTCAKPEDYKWMYLVCPRMNEAVYAEFSDTMNIEEIISMNPDVVFGSNEDYRALFENVGIPFINCMFTTYETMQQSIALTAEVLGGDAPKIAEKYFSYLNEKINETAAVTDTIDESDRKYVAHGSSIYKMGIDGLNTIIDEWIQLSGGINAAAKEIDGNLKEVTMEQLLAWDPDVIITGSDQAEVDAILSDPAWAALSAVQNGEVYANPKGIFAWDRYGVEEALQFQWASHILYPELFKDYDIETEVKYFYHEFLNYDLSDDQVAHILAHEDPADTDEIMSGSASAALGSRVLHDSYGDVTIEGEVSRVISTAPAYTISALLMGGIDKLVGIDANSADNEWLKKMFPRLADVEVVVQNGELNLETVLSLKPDLIILTPAMSGQQDRVTELGVLVINEPIYDEDATLLERNRDRQAYYGVAFGGESQEIADKYEAYFDSLVDPVYEATEDLSDDERPVVLEIRNLDPLTVCNGNDRSVAQDWITAAGGVNAAGENTQDGKSGSWEVSVEQVIAWDPEFIVCSNSATRADLMADARFANITAVKEENVIDMPKGLMVWGYNGPELPLFVEMAGRFIHPELFEDVDIIADAKYFYSEFFGLEVSDEELQQIFFTDLPLDKYIEAVF